MVQILDNPDKASWDRYASCNRMAKYAHLSAWGESLAATYSLPLYRLAAVNVPTGDVCGILSLMLFVPPGGDVRLISLPYTDAAGIVADDEESTRQLLNAALNLAVRLNATHLELRQGGALQSLFAEDTGATAGCWHHAAHSFKTGLVRRVPSSEDELWSSLSAKVRNQVRKARRCGCVAAIGGSELLADFYGVFAENMRDLGSPVHDRELFRRILDGDSCRTACIVVSCDGQPAAAAVVLQHGGTIYNPWASSLRRYRASCPNMLLYWSMLAHAVSSGCRLFDFGRSTPDAPTCRFKMQWGAKKEPLVWHVFSQKGYRWSPTNESLELEDWKAMELTRSIAEGPALRRWISL